MGVSQEGRKMLLHISLSICLLVVYIHSAATTNITITSSPKLGADTVLCLNESVTLTCHTDQSVANITCRWSNRSEHGETITVKAELTEVMYTCIASDDGKDMGQASITIIANGCAPIVTRENFRYYISRIEGSNLTLTTTTTSNLPISSGYPVWKVLHGQPLPPTAKVINYTIDGVIYSNLSLYNLSYYDDTGNYTCIASNECGTSSVFTFIEVTKAPIMCNNSGSVAIPLHNVMIIVQGDFVQISCIFKGNLGVLGASLTSYWSLIPPPAQHNNMSYVTDNTTDPYRIAVYQTCLTSGGSCCNFTNQLTILNISSSLDGYKLSCVETLNTAGSEPAVHTNTTSIIVLAVPRIAKGPMHIKHKERNDIILQCQFNASTIPGVTVVVWKKNNVQLFNSSHYNIIQSSVAIEDQVVSTLNIINSNDDFFGTYTCYCYYNSSLVTRASSKPITSDSKSLTLELSNEHGNSWRIAIIGIGVANSIAIILIIILLIVRSRCPTLFAGSKFWTNDHFTESNDSDNIDNDGRTATMHSAASESYSQHVSDERPLLYTLPTDDPIESVAEVPQVLTEVPGEHREILNLIAPNLKDHGDMETLLPYLQKHQLVTSNEEFYLHSRMYSPGDKNQMLLRYLKKKGAKSLQKFLCCLNLAHEHAGHKVIADELKQIMQTKEINCNDFCSDDCKQACIAS